MATEITVGICGFARSQASVFAQLRLLEAQTTFYRPVNRATAEAWRQRAPQEFEFTLKAWQLITHEPSSPTYRKARVDIPAEKAGRYGCFKPTEEVAEAWAVTNEIREALDAKVVVFQTPPRFKETSGYTANRRGTECTGTPIRTLTCSSCTSSACGRRARAFTSSSITGRCMRIRCDSRLL